MSRARELALVLVGGTLGGAARIAVGELFPHLAATLPWDLLLINVIGSAGLGAAVAYSRSQGPLPYFPAIGPGFFGGFTTFSSIACLQWSAGLGTAASAGVLAATMAAAVLGAAVGWWFGDRPPTPIDERAIFEEENE
ncbi:CrcB family protein [Demequina sp. SYSU T00039]|uniref:Fluoride-specific ion channel n=1 Tax=Demequina lignilytica TaxID=3051663 RepID=A0AAW7M942_9MICO|nr:MULTISPECIES: CrcB family protein [unclassified Demequina]MDN4478250.1 CrcB family protein [Demequina sp. SYSU T00039-1]MDN4488300.1 CrcB family protein [Demequina sp. SYSU T00039]MDN4490153.1 CrcB family protein [Demequina sp. SYSU T00068]